jgi:predicted ABC-type ATPase
MARPVVFVLAGVNGAGKSSVGGELLRSAGLDWYNPDAFAREVRAIMNCSVEEANSIAWEEGRSRLAHAIRTQTNFALETTLGASTIPTMLSEAAATHDVRVWYCGLDSQLDTGDVVVRRVKAGGHDIPEARIRERWQSSMRNLIALLPRIKSLQVYDNSNDVKPGQAIPDPLLIMDWRDGKLSKPGPTSRAALARVPEWAKPLVEQALLLSGS